MRIASRVVGVVLAFAGLGFVALPGYVFAIGQWSSGAAIWSDDKQVQSASRFVPYFLAHRRELRVIALVGLAVSLIRVVAVSFGHGWSVWPLVSAWVALAIIGSLIGQPGTMDLDWQSVPERNGPIVNRSPTLWNIQRRFSSRGSRSSSPMAQSGRIAS